MPLPKRVANPQADADRFNARVQVGDAVDYSEVIGLDQPKRYLTRSPASVLGDHTAVVWLEGKTGCVCISHCVAANGPVFVNDRAAIEATFAADQEAEDEIAKRSAA